MLSSMYIQSALGNTIVISCLITNNLSQVFDTNDESIANIKLVKCNNSDYCQHAAN